MAPKSGSNPAAVNAYLAGVAPRFRETLEQLRKTIRCAAPEAEEVISYRLPAFRQNGMLVYYGAFADHCSLFIASARTRRRFASELRQFWAEKATCHFTPERPLPPDLVTRIVRARVKENTQRTAV